MKLKRALVWLAAFTPGLVLAWFLGLNPLPDALREQVVDLTGTWLFHQGDELPWAAPDFDDSTWGNFEVPGSFWARNIEGPTVWMRRHVVLPPHLEGRDLYLLLGNPRDGQAQVFLNGHPVGEHGLYDARWREDLDIGQGWLVHREKVKPGNNILALRYRFTDGYNGLAGHSAFLGPYETLGKHHMLAQLAETALRHGPLYAFVFIIILMLSFMVMEGRHGDAYRYGSIIAVALSAGVYLCAINGVGTAAWLSVPQRTHMLYFGPILVALSFLEFLEHYCLGRVTRWRKMNRLVCGVFLALGLAFPDRGFDLFGPFSGYLGVVMGYMTFLVVRDVLRGQRPLAPLLASAVVTTIVTAVMDLAGNLDLLDAPRVFSLGLANIPLVASVVVVADFLSISTLNKALSRSLGQVNAELAQALAASQQAVRLKGEFLANVSHELRTPLNPIINIPESLLEEFAYGPVARCPSCGSTFVLESGAQLEGTACPSCGGGPLGFEEARTYSGEPDRTAELLEVVRKSGLTLLQVVNQVLDMSRLESGKETLVTQRVQVAGLMREVVGVHQPQAAKANVRLLPPSVPEDLVAMLDASKVSQVLNNLLSNAVRFSGGKGTVQMGAELVDGFVVFTVKDDGAGIAPQDHAVIFEPFRQVDGKHTRQHGGTGLGLSITKALVEVHGGDIRVESALGQGSTFVVLLPFRAPPPA